jgi:ubiquinone/menaquinone biosynthesis C-methylase UbiE
MTRYTDLIYSGMNMDYAFQLCKYISENYLKGSRLLDVGCGKGYHILCFEKCGFDAHGLDIRKEIDTPKIKKCDIEIERFPHKDNSFDSIFAKSIIEHIVKPDNFLSECYRVLKPGGTIVILTPDWKSQLKFYWDDYSHYHPWTIKSLKDALIIFSFKNVECKYFLQLPFVWRYPFLMFIPRMISVLPDFLKWKTKDMRNGEDRKLIRFSKEKMLLAYGVKNEK